MYIYIYIWAFPKTLCTVDGPIYSTIALENPLSFYCSFEPDLKHYRFPLGWSSFLAMLLSALALTKRADIFDYRFSDSTIVLLLFRAEYYNAIISDAKG